MFRRKKNTNQYHNYIIVSERDTGAKHVHFSSRRLLAMIGVAVVVLSGVLFFSADTITSLLYKSKMKDLQANYAHLTETLVILQTQLDDVSTQMGDIEEAIEKAVGQFDFSDTDNYEIDYGIDYDSRITCESHEFINGADLVQELVDKVCNLFKEADAPEEENTTDNS